MISAERLSLIRTLARSYASRHMGGLIEAGDFENEAIARALVGRKSIEGPMKDLLRRQGWMKNYHAEDANHRQYSLRRVDSHGLRLRKELNLPRPERAVPDVERAVSRLRVLYIMVLRMRYWHDMEQQAVGRVMGFTQSRTSKIEKAALKQLKEALAS